MGLPPPLGPCQILRLAAGIWLVVLSALLFAIGDWWAASLLVVAAVLFWAMFYVLRIVQG